MKVKKPDFNGVFERLEPYVGKLTSTVLRGARGLVTVLWDGNIPRLPDDAAYTLCSCNINKPFEIVKEIKL